MSLTLRSASMAAMLALTACPCFSQSCATNLNQLKTLVDDQHFSMKWEETSMQDGKPLVVSIVEQDGALFLQFIKSQEGLWAESRSSICAIGEHLEARFDSRHVRFGPAASWMLKLALGTGGKFTLTRHENLQLKISTSGWQGLFKPIKDQ